MNACGERRQSLLACPNCLFSTADESEYRQHWRDEHAQLVKVEQAQRAAAATERQTRYFWPRWRRGW